LEYGKILVLIFVFSKRDKLNFRLQKFIEFLHS
jgi:hypothetical protein